METDDYSGRTDQAYKLQHMGTVTGAKRHGPEPQPLQWCEACLAVVLQMAPHGFSSQHTAEPSSRRSPFWRHGPVSSCSPGIINHCFHLRQ